MVMESGTRAVSNKYLFKPLHWVPFFFFSILLALHHTQHRLQPGQGLHQRRYCQHDNNKTPVVNYATWSATQGTPHKRLNHSSWPGFDTGLFPVACPGSTRSLRAWQELSTLLWTKSSINVMVVGGSEAAGVDCDDGLLKGKACAWSSRLVNMLSCAVPTSNINLHNLASGGTTITVALASLAAWIRSKSDLDVLLVDFIVNDSFEAQDMRSSTIGQNLIAAYEKFVILAYKYHPHLKIMFVNTCCLNRCIPVSNVIRIVADHYGIPLVSYTDIADVVSKIAGQKLQRDYWMTDAPHPPWVTHQFVADTVLHCIRQHLPLKYKTSQTQTGPSTLSAATAMARLNVCDSPLNEYSANAPSLEGVKASNWTFYEDRRGKPGFISNGPNATISFDVKFGPNPRMILTFLRGYKQLADAVMWFDTDPNKRLKLPGLYQPSDHEYGLNVTQSYLLVMDVAHIWFQPEYGLLGVLGFSIQPNTQTRVNFEVVPANNSTKFKIINVQSC